MVHEIKIPVEDYYNFWQEYKTAVIVDYSEDFKQWDTIVIKNETPKWANLPIYKKLSFIEPLPKNKLLLHLKK